MSEQQALYVRDGDAFVGTSCTKGSWHANGQSGGAVLALLGHVLEDVQTLAPMSLTWGARISSLTRVRLFKRLL